MGLVRIGAHSGPRSCVLGLAATAAALAITTQAADARHHGRVYVARHAAGVRHYAVAGAYSPPTASIVVDGNTAAVLQASNPDAPRHPASLTKVMTLYLLFERLEAGKITLDTPLTVSAHAAEQAPSKLGLKPGSTITVENAIKAVVTKSANDIAVTIAENLAGSEENFAKLMTQKARALGMSRTTYVNASGLPDDEQITTARDQALLGRAIESRFPRYYRYFSTPSFVYHGQAIRNHNHLLGAVGGVDGIKTGYTRDSGFNLVTSVHRDGRYIIAVVFGGRSAGQRDAHMRELISDHIREASLRRTTPAVVERVEPSVEPQMLAAAHVPLSPHVDAVTTAKTGTTTGATVGSNDPMQPVMVKTVTYRATPVQTASLAPMPALVPAAPHPLQAAAAPQPSPQLPPVEAPATAASTQTGAAKAAEPTSTVASVEPAPVHALAHGGWIIQIGAFDDENEAKQHLSAAQLKARRALARAEAFTERVQKGDKTFYRARFAGFDRATAEATCRQLKHDDIGCMALKD
jgi:D-alanyl-D-alanine carboxypeptidase